jgi:hypothetical protein
MNGADRCSENGGIIKRGFGVALTTYHTVRQIVAGASRTIA